MTIEEIEDGRVTATHTSSSDTFREMGIEPAQGMDELVIEDGQIVEHTITLNDETVAQLQVAMVEAAMPAEGAQLGFTNASAEGLYSVIVTAGPNMAAGLGTCDLSGAGSYTCTVTNNQPGAAGARQQMASTDVGTYTVDPDGMSTATATRTLADGSEMEVNYTCVTTEAEPMPFGLLITEFFCVQQEAADPTGSLSTAALSRLPEADLGEITARTTEETLQAHLQAFATGDVDAILADYADDAVFVTADGALHGKEEIRELFEMLVAAFPPGSTLEVQEQVIDGDTAYIVWTGESEQFTVPFATDTLIVRDGMIQKQTLAAQMEPKN